MRMIVHTTATAPRPKGSARPGIPDKPGLTRRCRLGDATAYAYHTRDRILLFCFGADFMTTSALIFGVISPFLQSLPHLEYIPLHIVCQQSLLKVCTTTMSHSRHEKKTPPFMCCHQSHSAARATLRKLLDLATVRGKRFGRQSECTRPSKYFLHTAPRACRTLIKHFICAFGASRDLVSQNRLEVSQISLHPVFLVPCIAARTGRCDRV